MKQVAGFWTILALLLLPLAEDPRASTWTDLELRLLESMQLSRAGPPPYSASNSVANDPRAVLFGKRLFFDPRFSVDGKIACSTCHQPTLYFTDSLPRAKGAGQTMRNTPTVVGTAYNSWYYWDGRRDTLWSQALVPFEAVDEMGSSRVSVFRLVGADEDYRKLYTEIFGEFPIALMSPALPRHAGPLGTDMAQQAWYGMNNAQQQSVNEVFSNLGKAIAAYERTLVPEMTRFDRYVEILLESGDEAAARLLSAEEISGLELFIDSNRTQCLQCHNGPMFTNGGFHNIGTGNFEGDRLDFGRVFGLRAVLLNEFNCMGPYSDAEPEQCLELRFLSRDAHVPLDGAFKVPSLRNLAQTAPYFHDGRFATLSEVLLHYNAPPPQEQTGSHELRPLSLSEDDLKALESFLGTLSN